MTIRFFASILFALSTLASLAQAPRLNRWHVVGPGGGGTMIAPTISPHDSRIVVEHCDMTGAYITADDGQSWRMFNLRGGVQTFVFDPVDRATIYAGNSALWRSSDSGKSWKMLFPSPARNTVEHQIGDHADYELTSDDPAYPGGEISAMAIDPHDPRHLYAAFSRRGQPAFIVSSRNRGDTWQALASLPVHVAQLASVNGEKLTGGKLIGGELIALAGSVAYRIEPDGHVVEQGRAPGNITRASLARAGDTVWFYATDSEGKLFVSHDSGQTWRPSIPALGQSAGRFEATAASADHPEIAYVGFRDLQLPGGQEHLYNGIAKTIDGGQTWKTVFQESNYGSANLKGTWIEQRGTQNGQSIFYDSPYSLGVAPTNPEIVYATDLFRTYRTLDGGKRWEEMNSARAATGDWTTRGLDVTTDYGVQFDPFDPRHIFIDYTDIGLFDSRDGGQSWRSRSEGVPEEWRNTTYWLAFDPAVRGLLWGAFSGIHDLPRPKMWRGRSTRDYVGGVGVSADGGKSWHPSGTGMPPAAITHILLDPESKPGMRTLYACAFGRGVYKSTDNGRTWQLRNHGIDDAEPFAWRITRDRTGALYLVVARRSEGKNPSPAGGGSLYRSTDGAQHWVRMELPEGVNGPTGLQVDPRDPQRLYLTAWGREGVQADAGGGVYVSDDRGTTWRALYTQSQHVYDLTIDSRNPHVLYICGFDAAAFRSLDRGAHWTEIKGYNFKWGHRVILDPNDPRQIYITTYGGGVWHGPAEGDPTGKADVASGVPIAH